MVVHEYHLLHFCKRNSCWVNISKRVVFFLQVLISHHVQAPISSLYPVTLTDPCFGQIVKANRTPAESLPNGGVVPSFDTMMEELASKIQGEQQTVRQFAAVVKSKVLNIYHHHPDQMSESCMSQVKRTQFFHRLKRTYKETYRHLYEEEEASFERILQAASTMEEALNQLMKIPKNEERRDPTPSPVRRSRLKLTPRKPPSWGWTRTGLEPEVVVHINDEPLDVLLDLGSDVSLIDQEITDNMNAKVYPISYEIPQCVRINECGQTNTRIKVIGWAEVELGILGLGCITARLWVAGSLYNKGVPIVLGSHLIKKILAQANVERMDCWQQPWKLILKDVWKVNGLVEGVMRSCQILILKVLKFFWVVQIGCWTNWGFLLPPGRNKWRRPRRR